MSMCHSNEATMKTKTHTYTYQVRRFPKERNLCVAELGFKPGLCDARVDVPSMGAWCFHHRWCHINHLNVLKTNKQIARLLIHWILTTYKPALWLRGKKSACQCRSWKRCGFDPWVGKIPWNRKWQPAPVFLPGKSHGQRSLVGYSPCGCKELDTTEHTHTSPKPASRKPGLLWSVVGETVSPLRGGQRRWEKQNGVLKPGTSLAVLWSRLHFPMQAVWVQSLVRELGSHRPQGQKNQHIKQKQYCNKFNKDFKNGPH